MSPDPLSIGAPIAALVISAVTAIFGWRMSRKTNGRIESLEERLLRENRELRSEVAQLQANIIELEHRLVEALG